MQVATKAGFTVFYRGIAFVLVYTLLENILKDCLIY